MKTPGILDSDTVDLPRLAYVSDVPVERTVAGPLLLYRLLETYASGRLTIIQGNLYGMDRTRQLPGISYQRFWYGPQRLLNGRFAKHWRVANARVMFLWSYRIAHWLRRERAEAVLSVAEGYLWLAAVAAAERLGLPAHLIVHDDWLSFIEGAARNKRSRQQIFFRTYRRATTRLCISPYMAEEYERLSNVAGQTLYPCRGEDSPIAKVRVRPELAGQSPVIAYAGSIWNGYDEVLSALRDVLATMNGRLDIYTNTSPDSAEARKIAGPNVRMRGFMSPLSLAEQIPATAHALFVPMRFSEDAERQSRTAFPSKIPEYAGIGLPMLIWAPPYSSAFRWACDYPGVAEVVTDPAGRGLAEAVLRLSTDPARSAVMAARAIEVANQCFSIEAARRTFYGALRNASQKGVSYQSAHVSSI